MALDEILIGCLIGLILSLTGAGGSIIASPLLMIVTGISINDATGLSLVAICISSGLSSIYGYFRGEYALRPVVYLSLSGMLMASCARYVVEYIDENVMGVLFSLMAFIFSSYYLFGDRAWAVFGGWRYRFKFIRAPAEGEINPRSLLAWGSFAGALSGFFGVGGGIILVPIVWKILRISWDKVIYYCLPIIFMITLTGSATFVAIAGPDILSHLYALVTGAVLGSVIGLAALPFIPPKFNLRLLGVAVFFFACLTMYRSLT